MEASSGSNAAKPIGGKLGRRDFEWFDAKRYEAAARYTPADWANALGLRASLSLLVKFGHASAEPLVANWLADPVNLRPRSPMLGPGGPAIRDQTVHEAYQNGMQLEHGVMGDLLRECCPEWGVGLPGWGREPLGPDQMQRLTASLGDLAQLRRAQYDAIPLLEQSLNNFKLPYDPMTRAGLAGVVVLNVDLSASDEQLRQEFDAWLTTKRSLHDMGFPNMRPVKRKGGRVVVDGVTDHLRDAQAYRVLPYIDLRLFAQIRQGELTQALAGELLFPDEDTDSTEKVRKYTAPLAEYLMSLPALFEISHWGGREG
ncbi:DUF6387 family protein [Cupriavidus basilensis]